MELRHWVLAAFIASALYAHLRGKVRFELKRALDFTIIIAPVNALMYLFSRTPRTAYIPTEGFPDLAPLQQHWRTIREEALRLNDEGYIRAAAGYNDIGFNSFFRTGWKRFYLNWYGKELPSAQALCPKTVALLQAIPSVKAAMFASLPPGCEAGAPPRPVSPARCATTSASRRRTTPGCYIERGRRALPLARRRGGDVRRDLHPPRREHHRPARA